MKAKRSRRFLKQLAARLELVMFFYWISCEAQTVMSEF